MELAWDVPPDEGSPCEVLLSAPLIPFDDAFWLADEVPAMRALEQAVRGLQCVDPSALSGEVALAELAALLAAQTKLKLVQLDRVADVEQRALHQLDGAPTTTAWLEVQDADVDRREVALAKKMRRLPLVSAEVAEGELSLRAATKLQTALSLLRRRVDRPDGLIDGHPGEAVLEAVLLEAVPEVVGRSRGGLADDDPMLTAVRAQCRAIAYAAPDVCGSSQIDRLEAAFLLVAKVVEPHQLTSCLGLLVGALLPEELEARAARAAARRGLGVVRKADGSGWRVEGDLDLETGELLWVFLDSEMRRDPDNPVDTRAACAMRDADLDPTEPDDLSALPSTAVPRSRGERLHDALRLGLTRYLGAALGGICDKVPVHIGVTVGVERLAGEAGRLPARSDSGALLPLTLVRRWWCDASVTRFVMGLGRLVFETSHTGRTTTGQERRAKHVETGGQCQCGGCRGDRSVPGTVLTPHHVEAYAVGGRTSHRETVLLCPASHHDVHEGGKTIQLKDGRWLNARGWAPGPDG